MRSLLSLVFAALATGAVMCAPCDANAAAGYAPIDCAKAVTATDKLICATYSLGQTEARMATLYGIATALVAMGQRGDIGDAQVQWLKQREACGGSLTCIEAAYAKRIPELQAVIDSVVAKGPF